MNSKKFTLSDSVEIMEVYGIHTNTCDPIFADQYIVARIKQVNTKNVLIFFLQKIMHQISID